MQYRNGNKTRKIKNGLFTEEGTDRYGREIYKIRFITRSKDEFEEMLIKMTISDHIESKEA